MNEIEKIHVYIKRTGVEYPYGTPYQMNLGELIALRRMDDVGDAIALAFEYGRAKGERSARAAQKRQKRRTAV